MKGYELIIELNNPEGETTFLLEMFVTPELGTSLIGSVVKSVFETAEKKAATSTPDLDLSSIFSQQLASTDA